MQQQAGYLPQPPQPPREQVCLHPVLLCSIVILYNLFVVLYTTLDSYDLVYALCTEGIEYEVEGQREKQRDQQAQRQQPADYPPQPPLPPREQVCPRPVYMDYKV